MTPVSQGVPGCSHHMPGTMRSAFQALSHLIIDQPSEKGCERLLIDEEMKVQRDLRSHDEEEAELRGEPSFVRSQSIHSSILGFAL